MAAKISAARALAQRLAEEKAAVAVAARASADGSLDEEELVQCVSLPQGSAFRNSSQPPFFAAPDWH